MSSGSTDTSPMECSVFTSKYWVGSILIKLSLQRNAAHLERRRGARRHTVLKLLFATYWLSPGWKEKREIGPELFLHMQSAMCTHELLRLSLHHRSSPNGAYLRT